LIPQAINNRKLKLSLLVLILCQLFLGIFSFVATPSTNAQSPIANTNVNPYGVNTFLDREVEDWKKERTFQMLKEAGIGWIKQIFPWNELEFKKGYFYDDKFKKSSWQKFDQIVNLAQKYGIKIVARLDQTPEWARPEKTNPGTPPTKFQDYADFLSEFVKHYKGKISHIQVWNEPNLGAEWSGPVNPAKYTEMLKLAYTAIKKIDPSVKVMSAPLAMNTENFKERINLNELDFLTEMYQAGAKEHFDILSANGYGLEFPPEDAPDPKKLNFRRVELLRDIMVKNGDAAKAIWFNEFGWNASPADFPKDKLIWRRVTEQQQADYTARGIKYAREKWNWSGVVFIWYFRQVGDIPPDRSDHYFQMVTTQFQPKPVFNAIKKDAVEFLAKQGQPTPAPATAIAPPATTAVVAQVTNTPSTVLNPSPTSGQTGNNPTVTVAPNPTPTGRAVVNPAPTTTPIVIAPAGSSGGGDSGMLVVVILGAVILLAGGGIGAYLWFGRRQA
jgi:Cellulase (glycosyl hydrolase family 5)